MSWNDLSVLAVVPARGGSKGIPRKNLCRVGEHSLIGWAARTASEIPELDAAVLSTDDEEMAEEGRRVGLTVPFLRPPEFATDGADSVGMWRHAWLASEEHFGRRFEISMLLQPTTPLRRAEDCRRALAAVAEGGHRAATTVTPLPGHFTPGKILARDPEGRLSFAFPELKTSRRQDAADYFYRNGACYVVRRETLVDHGHIVEDDCAAVVVEEELVNIDDPRELELARREHADRQREER